MKISEVLDLFKTENATGGTRGPREASTAGGSAAAGAQPSEGRAVTRKAGETTGTIAPSSSADTVKLQVRMRQVVVDAIGAAVEASPIEFANSSDFVRRAIEHELQRRGLLKTYR